jgi:tetratricopeptide (TPR) repeat protein
MAVLDPTMARESDQKTQSPAQWGDKLGVQHDAGRCPFLKQRWRVMYALLIRAFLVCSLPLVTAAPSFGEDHAGKHAEQLGKVSFANSCDAAVQPSFERGIALLHSFWWQEGRQTFLKVLDQDPTCAVAAWGVATIDVGNPFATGPNPAQAQQAQETIARGRAIGAKTERERLYIEAIAGYYDRFAERSHNARMKSVADAFEALASRFPDDDEAQIFYALYLVATQDPTDKSFARTLKAADILEAQFTRQPDHPGVAHYLIHSYDYPPIAEKGLSAARRYAAIAPSAPHALHMPSHIFTRVGAWEDSIATNSRSVAASKAEGDADQQLHAMDYMVYADLQLARDDDARSVIAAIEQAGTPTAARTAAFATAAMPARYALERGAWREATQLLSSDSRIPYIRAMPVFARAIGAARSGDAAAAEKDVQELAQLVNALKDTKDGYWATEVDVQYLAAAAWTEYAKGSRDRALALMRNAADMENKSEKSAVTPGRILPARELLGDMLLENGNAAEALIEYEASLMRDPRRFRSLFGAGQAAERLGDTDKARRLYGELVDMTGSRGSRPDLDKARAYLARD